MGKVISPFDELIECPICSGRGTVQGRAWRRRSATDYQCSLCAGSGSVRRSVIRGLEELRTQMQRVADAMQAGDSDRAAAGCRAAVRLARPLLRR
jgi:DnaJ-class molecular chaperone